MAKQPVGGSQPAGSYSPGIVAEGRFVYVSGQGPFRDGALSRDRHRGADQDHPRQPRGRPRVGRCEPGRRGPVRCVSRGRAGLRRHGQGLRGLVPAAAAGPDHCGRDFPAARDAGRDRLRGGAPRHRAGHRRRTVGGLTRMAAAVIRDVAELAVPRASLGEGPCWDAKVGALYWTDIPAHRVHRLTGDGTHTEWDTGQPVGAVVPRASGRPCARCQGRLPGHGPGHRQPEHARRRGARHCQATG